MNAAKVKSCGALPTLQISFLQGNHHRPDRLPHLAVRRYSSGRWFRSGFSEGCWVGFVFGGFLRKCYSSPHFYKCEMFLLLQQSCRRIQGDTALSTVGNRIAGSWLTAPRRYLIFWKEVTNETSKLLHKQTQQKQKPQKLFDRNVVLLHKFNELDLRETSSREQIL